MTSLNALPVLMLALICSGIDARAQEATDPFADLTVPTKSETTPESAPLSWKQKFLTENFGFRKEFMSEFDATNQGSLASRQSIGFEALKKFSSENSTIASFDIQVRLVRRDGYNPVMNDMEGSTRAGWALEYHNLYLDLYNVFNPLMGGARRKASIGRFNFRVGRYYVPFGLNLQTDTHGAILQLSNEQSFGFERDWYTGFWGALNKHLNYDVNYLVGSGYDLRYKGQKGLGSLRLSLANRYGSEYGIEAGVSILAGERLIPGSPQPMETRRAGVDGRYRRAIPTGLLTFTSELSGGRDRADDVVTQLYQTDYLRASRRWGLASQYRRFRKESETDASLAAEATWYFRNDVGNSNLHWIKLNVEHKAQAMPGMLPMPVTSPWTVTLQYYFYR